MYMSIAINLPPLPPLPGRRRRRRRRRCNDLQIIAGGRQRESAGPVAAAAQPLLALDGDLALLGSSKVGQLIGADSGG